MAQVVGLNFHQTFKPEKQYIAAILDIAGDPDFRTIKEISMMTGIPTGESSGKVEPHIIYADYMGLINYEKKDGKYCLTRSFLGETVYMEDPGLQEKLTKLLCHAMIVRRENGAKLWSAIFRNVMPRYKTGIKRDLLIKELTAILDGNITTKNIAPFFGSYDSFFDSLSVVFDDGETLKPGKAAYDKEFIYAYGLALLAYWKEQYPDQDEITSDQLKEMHFGCVFGWDVQDEYAVLEHLSDKGIIRMNRQLMPYTVLLLAGYTDLVERMYSELC